MPNHDHIFKALVIMVFLVRYKEAKEPPMRKMSALLKRVYRELHGHKALLALTERERHKKECALLLEQSFKEDKLSDGLVLEAVAGYLASDEDRGIFLDVLSDIILLDGVISVSEQEGIHMLARCLGIAVEPIYALLERKKKRKNRGFVAHERIYSKGAKIFAAFCALVGVVLLGLSGAGIFSYIENKKAFSRFDLQSFIEQKPTLIFKRVEFSKFIIHGSAAGTSGYTDRLNVFHIKGSADFEFDLSRLSVDKEQSDYALKKLVLRYKEGDSLPLLVNVNIAPENVTLIHEIVPKPISRESAQKVAKVAAIPASGVGALLGGKIGAEVVKIPVLGGIMGGALGGALAGGGSYIATRNFLTGFSLASNTLGDKERILNQVKPLIALELIGGSMLTGESWREEVQRYYWRMFERQLEKIMREHFGFERVEIIHGGEA